MTDLSPAAQQVFWEFNRAASGKPDDWHYLPAIAAVLRAVVEQVVPEQDEPPCGENEPWPQSYQLMSDSMWQQRQLTRYQLLAIAAELEGASD